MLDINEVRAEAERQSHKVAFDHAVMEEKRRLYNKKAHLFPKKLKLQLPFRLEDHYQAHTRRRGDKGRTV